MPIPRYISTASEFTAELSPGSRETKFRDFKWTIDNWRPDDGVPNRANMIREAQMEVCRDIAQFANTEGGCLLIGVAEHQDISTGLRVFDKVIGIDNPEEMKDWISSAIQNFLTPKTFSHTIDAIHLPEGVILAVNIQPSRHMVTLWDRTRRDRRANTIEYLYRTSHGKAWMNPSEAEAYMMSSSRFGRIAIERAITKFDAQPGSAQRQLYVDLVSGVFQDTGQGRRRWNGGTITLRRPTGEDDDTFELSIAGTTPTGSVAVWVPFGAVRDCWLGKDKGGNTAIGLLLFVRLMMLGSGNIVLDG